jgi:hypothetical protein
VASDGQDGEEGSEDVHLDRCLDRLLKSDCKAG